MKSTIIKKSQLKLIPPSQIFQNPDNPRLFFREEELDTLIGSIGRFGIQVPVTVYPSEDHYILIDGERRWRCAHELNLKTMPALIQEKPTKLENLLLMFNIHMLREQWDYLTIAKKIPEVIERYADANNGNEPNEPELSELTGLTRGMIRRCKMLINMPPRYMNMLIVELNKPKQFQELSEDFFIEMENALRAINKRLPHTLDDIDSVRDSLIDKYRNGIIGNITDFRSLSKIATALDKSFVSKEKASSSLETIFDPDNEISIREIFEESYELLYDERKVINNIKSITGFLEGHTDVSSEEFAGEELVEYLRRLKTLLDNVLEG